jgi:hypothetical protein
VSATRRHLGAVLGALIVVLVPRAATAYCLTNTCTSVDDDDGECREEDGCVVGGEPLAWSQRCISFSVQADGSTLRGISLDDARRIIGEGFYTWMHATCPEGGSPAIEVFDLGPVDCRAAEFDLEQRNANIWVFRDSYWPYDDVGTLALTTVTFNPRTGEIFDADVEVNTVQNAITIGDGDVTYDFASIATHEAGHVLGLSHSPELSATMYAAYDAGSVTTRQLHLDDVHGICAAIPPNRDVPEACDPLPINGFSPECHDTGGGCLAVAPRGRERGAPLGLLLLSVLVGRRLIRRRGASGDD